MGKMLGAAKGAASGQASTTAAMSTNLTTLLAGSGVATSFHADPSDGAHQASFVSAHPAGVADDAFVSEPAHTDAGATALAGADAAAQDNSSAALTGLMKAAFKNAATPDTSDVSGPSPEGTVAFDQPPRPHMADVDISGNSPDADDAYRQYADHIQQMQEFLRDQTKPPVSPEDLRARAEELAEAAAFPTDAAHAREGWERIAESWDDLTNTIEDLQTNPAAQEIFEKALTSHVQQASMFPVDIWSSIAKFWLDTSGLDSSVGGVEAATTGANSSHSTAFAEMVAKTPTVRIVGADGTLSNHGLLQVKGDHGWGTVSGMNDQTASAVCRQMGYDGGSKIAESCRSLEGHDYCGAEGSPIAVKDLNCTGKEFDIAECQYERPDEASASHADDALIHCTKLNGLPAQPSPGDLRLVDSGLVPSTDGRGLLESYEGGQWTPVCSHGFTAGSAAVACKQMGFAGLRGVGFSHCGDGPHDVQCSTKMPEVETTCNGAESHTRDCIKTTGDGVSCKPEEAVVLTCAGKGETSGIVPEKVPAPLAESSMGRLVVQPLLGVAGGLSDKQRQMPMSRGANFL
eukprot:TRINITY_DN18049_c0_g1_i3.p1 TRINITY_DN18049_c0_g1~~TRINITY_DN18049_c0_g1_i3.p1  ORF type:complete len:599 (-),score=78.68 TRINITY_DN18049_c0_g1_i3:261-1982(-)